MKVREEYVGSQVYVKEFGLIDVTVENLRYFELVNLDRKYFENDKDTARRTKRRKGNTKRVDNDSRSDVAMGIHPPTAKDRRSGDTDGHSDSSAEKEI